MAFRRGDRSGHRHQRRTRGGRDADHLVDLAARLGIEPSSTGHSEHDGRHGAADIERLRRAVRSHRRRRRMPTVLAALLLVLALAVLALVLFGEGGAGAA